MKNLLEKNPPSLKNKETTLPPMTSLAYVYMFVPFLPSLQPLQ